MGKKGKRGNASAAKKSRKLASYSLHELLLFIIDKTHTIEDLLSIRGTSPQYIFTRAAELNLIFRLEDLYANYDIDINQITEMSREPFRIYKDTPLHAAVDGNSANAVKWLLDKGADPNSVSESIINGEKDVLSSLWRAAEFGNSRIGYLLLKAGADPNTAKLSTGNTALYIAVQNNQKEMITLLLSVDACPNTIGKGGIQRSLPPIICAISKGNLDVVAQLINAGAFLTHMHKMWANPILEQMQNSGMTAAGEYSRKISQKEIRLLTELIDVRKIEKLRNDETYQMACSQEKRGNYREALMLLQRVPLKLAKAQLMQDIERLITFLYGCKGSDGLTSIWKQYPPSKKEIRPFPLQFGAWVQVGRKVYTHGGLDFMDKQIFSRKTRMDELWELDIDKRVWRYVFNA